MDQPNALDYQEGDGGSRQHVLCEQRRPGYIYSGPVRKGGTNGNESAGAGYYDRKWHARKRIVSDLVSIGKFMVHVQICYQWRIAKLTVCLNFHAKVLLGLQEGLVYPHLLSSA